MDRVFPWRLDFRPRPVAGGRLDRHRRTWGAFVPADKVHLTGKPLPLLVDLLGVTPEGGTILDPFMGGGTTACIQTGRRFVGVELSAEYFELACRRLESI